MVLAHDNASDLLFGGCDALKIKGGVSGHDLGGYVAEKVGLGSSDGSLQNRLRGIRRKVFISV